MALGVATGREARADGPTPGNALGFGSGPASVAADPASTAAVPLAGPAPRTSIGYTLEDIEVRGNRWTSAGVVKRMLPFAPGAVLDVNDPELTLARFRLLGTGFFSSVTFSLKRGSVRGAAILVVDVVERNTLLLENLWLGVAADEDTAGNAKPISPFVGVQIAETNLLGSGMTVGAGIGLAEDQISLRARFYEPSLFGSRFSLLIAGLYADARDHFGNRDVRVTAPVVPEAEGATDAVVAYRRMGGMIGTGTELSSRMSFALDYRFEHITAHVPGGATHLYGESREPISFPIVAGESLLSALRATWRYDTRDLPFLTKQGTLAQASVTAALPPFGSSYNYQRVELSYQRWWTLPWGHVFRLDAFAGAIAGQAPFFEKFYIGDFSDPLPDRVLDIAPDRRRAPNYLGTDIVEVRHGDFAARLEAEYRIPLYTGKGSIYGIDLFGRGGLYSVATEREFSHPARGYDGARRIPVDINYNIGFRADTSIGGITLAFSNLLGLLPSQEGRPQ